MECVNIANIASLWRDIHQNYITPTLNRIELNENLANCLSRVHVSEDRFWRKMREIREDGEEKEHQARVAKLRDERTSRSGVQNEEQEDDQPS